MKIPKSLCKELQSLEETTDLKEAIKLINLVNNNSHNSKSQKKHIEPLRSLLSNMIVKSENSHISCTIYNILLYLARHKPLNKVCCITGESIARGDSFISASGHQYHLPSLAKWVKTSKKFFVVIIGYPFYKY